MLPLENWERLVECFKRTEVSKINAQCVFLQKVKEKKERLHVTPLSQLHEKGGERGGGGGGGEGEEDSHSYLRDNNKTNPCTYPFMESNLLLHEMLHCCL